VGIFLGSLIILVSFIILARTRLWAQKFIASLSTIIVVVATLENYLLIENY
jgi:hypothetical protein